MLLAVALWVSLSTDTFYFLAALGVDDLELWVGCAIRGRASIPR
jgi:hypothetical protein